MSGYSDGRRLEYAARDALEADGYAVLRSAGSKTPVDLVAWKLDEMLFVQCKASKPIGPAERDQLRGLAALVRAVPLEARWVKDGRAARQVRFWHVLPDNEGRPARAGWTADHAIGAETDARLSRWAARLQSRADPSRWMRRMRGARQGR